MVKIADGKYCRHGGGGVKNPENLPMLFMDGLIGIMRSTLCTPNFSDPPPALTYTLEPDLLAWGPFKMLFPPLVGVCSGVHFHFECTFMTLTPFPLAGFFKISLAVCYFSSGFGP